MLQGVEVTEHELDAPEAAMIYVDLVASIISVRGDEPVVLVSGDPARALSLPSVPYVPTCHGALEAGLVDALTTKTGTALSYLEQLFTLGESAHRDHDRANRGAIAVGYLGLLPADAIRDLPGCAWRRCFDLLPWEDRRHADGRAALQWLEPRLRAWAESVDQIDDEHAPPDAMERVRMLFGLDGAQWDDERVQDRFDILVEAGLLQEARPREPMEHAPGAGPLAKCPPMRLDDQRILATALGRLRARIRVRPLAFELMPREFTLFELQRTVEAILGPNLHKQNFRRLVEGGGLVEPTGEVRMRTGGRPAKLFRFRREALLERPAFGLRLRGAGLSSRA